MSAIKLTLKKIDPVKYATIATLVYLLILLIIYVPIILLGSLVGGTNDMVSGAAMLGGGIVGIIFVMIFAGAIVFVITLIAGYIINFILNKTGGLPMEFEGRSTELSQIGQTF